MSISKPNSLINQKSPYLLQHAHNPVNWYAWGDEAFKLANELDKPIFLSIGYSTCHWCHVMEHESFEDDDVAALLNDAFISIKVDREERPDIDSIYMNVCQMLTGSGGWPLTILMTPEKQPFFAGTYFPKESRMGRIGMLELIPRVAGIWQSNRDEIVQSVDRISSALGRLSVRQSKTQLNSDVLDRGFDQLSNEFDADFGGFGRAPKFPTPHRLTFLLRYWKRTANMQALSMAIETLQHMARGGVFDHLGGGFHRYSTDRQWLLPHFEKMLYDQALIANAYLEVFDATRDPNFERIARLILDYVLRDMTSRDGGFYSAEDADSEGEEGTFYIWKRDEIAKVLGDSAADDFCEQYGIESEGNFLEEATGHRTGDNILNLIGRATENSDQFANARSQLFEHRETRIHPYKDDKILTDWNGLMIATMARAGRVLDESTYSDAARNAWSFISREMFSADEDLLHRYRDGEAAISGYIDDYAFLVMGLIELYETTFDIQYLISAVNLQKKAVEQFWDEDQGAFYFVDSSNKDVLVRLKESYDGAIPSGNSISMMNMLKLGRMTGNTDWEQKAWTIGEYFSEMIDQVPASHAQMLSAIDFSLNDTFEIVIVGGREDPATHSMLSSLRSHYLPNAVVLFLSMENLSELIEIAPYLEGFEMIDQKATAYICKNYTCDLPVTDLAEFDDRIQALNET